MKPERDGLASPARKGRRQWLLAVLCGGVGLAVVDRVPAVDAEDLRKVSLLAYLMSIPCYALVLAYGQGQALRAFAGQSSALITFVKVGAQCSLLVGFVLAGLVPVHAAAPVQVEECCTSAFEFDEVAMHASALNQRTARDYGVTILVPPGGAKVFSIASTSEEGPASCHSRAVQIRNQLSHAFVFRTPLGVSLHYWNNRSSDYRRTTLSGTDVFDSVMKGATLAWIGPVSGKSPDGTLWLHIVTAERPSIETAPRLAREFMRLLGIDSALALVREDGYYWPGACYPYSFPAQWRKEQRDDGMAPRMETIFCRLGKAYKTDGCVQLVASGN